MNSFSQFWLLLIDSAGLSCSQTFTLSAELHPLFSSTVTLRCAHVCLSETKFAICTFIQSICSHVYLVLLARSGYDESLLSPEMKSCCRVGYIYTPHRHPPGKLGNSTGHIALMSTKYNISNKTLVSPSIFTFIDTFYFLFSTILTCM